MRDREYARRSATSFGAYLAATAVVLGGFFGLLVFAAHPVLMTVAAVGMTVGAAAGRIVRKIRRLACLLAGDCRHTAEAGPETA